jgi:ankyrin repeat protein
MSFTFDIRKKFGVSDKGSDSFPGWEIEYKIIDAIQKGDTKYIQKILWSGLSPDFKFTIRVGRMDHILLQAVFHNQIDIVKLLIEDGADINIKNQQGENALVASVIFNDDDEIFDYLIDNGIDKDIIVIGGLPLITSTMFRNKKRVYKLLKNGANPNLMNKFNQTSLHYAVTNHYQHNSSTIIKLLIYHGADIDLCNIDNETPLFKAAMMYPLETNTIVDYFEIIDILLESGANPYIKTNQGKNVFSKGILPNRKLYIKNKINQLHHLNIASKMIKLLRGLNTESKIDCLSDDVLQLIRIEMLNLPYNHNDTKQRLVSQL